MKMSLFSLCAWLLIALTPAGAGQREKISVPELLEPETRLKAFRDFLARRGSALEYMSRMLRGELSLIRQTAKDGTPAYVVFGQTAFETQSTTSEEYPRDHDGQLFPPPKPPLPQPTEAHLFCFVFDADGLDITPGRDLLEVQGFVRDLNGDGVVDLLEFRNHGSYSLLRVRELLTDKVLFSVAYLPPAVPLATGIVKRDEGVYDLVLGPKALDVIEPAAIFRWDAKAATWSGPTEAAGSHLVDVREVESWDIDRALRPSYPAEEKRVAEPEFVFRRLPAEATRGGRLRQESPANRLSHPYRKQSLARFTHEEILAWMGIGRTPWDLQSQPRQVGLLVPEIWRGDPRSAALQFVKSHLPPEVASITRLAVDDLDGEAPPEEGTVAVSDGPSGCFSPAGAYEYFLHCDRESSYFVVSRRLMVWHDADPLEENVWCDVRQVPLSYEEGRRVLQMVWWMDRIRSKQTAESHGGGMHSTSDAPATARLNAPGVTLHWSGTRYADDPFFVRGELGSDSYDRVACLNAVLHLLADELPAQLDERWRRFDVHAGVGAAEIPNLAHGHTPESLSDLKRRVAELIELGTKGGLDPEVMREIVMVAEDLGLKRLLPHLASIAKILPPPGKTETRLHELNEKISAQRQRFGEHGTAWIDYLGRREEARGLAESKLKSTSLPGLDEEPTSPAATTPPLLRSFPPADPTYTELDALYEEQDRLKEQEPQAERSVAALREALQSAQHWLPIYDDSDRLYALAMGNLEYLYPSVRRLRALGVPKRAIAALEHWLPQVEAKSNDLSLRKSIDSIRMSQPGGKPLSPEETARRDMLRLTKVPKSVTKREEAAALINVIVDTYRPVAERLEAWRLLIPAARPKAYRDAMVDDFLMRAVQGKFNGAELLQEEAAQALALRGGGKHWDLLAAEARKVNEIGMARLGGLLPGLLTITLAEPRVYRGKLLALLAPQLENSRGGLSSILWAVWLADLRELKPHVEQLATSSPEEIEGELATSASTQERPVQQRFHAARQIASLWDATDNVVCARLLIAAGLEQSAIDRLGGTERLRRKLKETAAQLKPAARQQVRTFLLSCQNRQGAYAEGTREARWLQRAKAALAR